MPETPVIPVGKLKPVTQETVGIKPVGKLKPIGIENDNTFNDQADLYTQVLTGGDKMVRLNETVNAVPDIDDTQKKILKDLAIKGAKQEDLKQAILTFQGQHPLQEGSNKYYYNERGIPTPLKSDERPPQGFDVANDLHGTQEEADKVGFINSAGRHLYNGVIKGVLGLEGLANLPYSLATGEDADWYKAAKNRVESSLYKTPQYEQEDQFFDSKDMKEIGDIFDPKRYKFNANIAQGQILNGLESISSFLVGTKGLGAVSKLGGAFSEGAGIIGQASKYNEAGQLIQKGSGVADFLAGTTSGAQKAQAYGSAYALNYPDVDNYVKEAGVEGQEGKALAAAITVPVSLLEVMFGTEGLFVKNAVAKQAKDNLVKGIVDGIAKNAEGKFTKEALADAFKATTTEAFKLNKSFARDLGENIAEEAGTEGLQEFTKRGLAKLYDHVSQQDNFKDNPISAEAFGDYFNAALSGAAGAMGPSTAATIQKRKQEIEKRQNNNIFNTVQKGDEAVTALKLNISKAVDDGEITAEQGANAIFKVNAYSEYNKQMQGKPLKEEDKKRVFELTFEKQNLEQGIPTDYKAEQMNGIAQAEIEAKKKQAKHIQDEINDIFLKHDVENKTTAKAKKTEEEIAKAKEQKGKPTKEDYKSVDETGKYKTPNIVNYFPEYEKITKEEWNHPKDIPSRVKKYKLADYVEKQPTKSMEGVVKQDYRDKEKGIDTFNVTLPDGKAIRFASSMVRKPNENELGGFRGNTYEENFSDKEKPLGQKVGITVKTLKDSGRKVLFVWNADKSSSKYGKHIGMIKESLKGKSNYSEADLDEMADLRMTNMAPEGGETIAETVQKGPVTGPADVRFVAPKVDLTQPTRENLRNNYINKYINELKQSGDYNPDFQKVYEKSFGAKFDRLNPTLYAEESATTQTESTARSAEEVNGENISESKTKKVRTGTKRSQRKIKDPKRLKALDLEVFSPRAYVMQYFIGGGRISRDDFKKFKDGSEKETRNRQNLLDKNSKLTRDQLAHDLWEEYHEFTPWADVSEYKNEVEDVLNSFQGPSQMAQDLLDAYSMPEERIQEEEIVGDMHVQSEKDGTAIEVEKIQDKLEEESDENLTKLANDQKAFDKWEEDSDIKYFEGDIPFQKSKELEYAEAELIKAEKELAATKKAFDNKRKELDKGLIEDQEDLFGERKSTDETSLFDERATVDARNEAVKPFKDRYDAAVKNYKKWSDKVQSLEGSEDTQTSLFQKVSSKRIDIKAKTEKILETLAKAMPKVKVKHDPEMIVAGMAYKGTVYINPWYAGLDTPIHEYGHIFIDAIGYKDPIIQKAIDQLRGTDLWKETAKRYPELTEEQFGKEVLAEAIGREGAGIFDKESEKSKFRKYLDYIFTKLKQLFGLDKNVAKSLTKQIIGGIGTAEMEGKSTEVQAQKPKVTPEEIQDMPLTDLINQYWEYVNSGVKGKKFEEVKKQLGYKLFQTRKQEILDSPNAEKFIEKLANTENLGKTDVLFKTLSHMSESFPELQKFSKEFENANFDMVQEANKLKSEAETLARAVIEEKNKKLGIKGKLGSMFSSDNAKYFEYLENPTAVEEFDEDTGETTYSPGYWTEEEAKAKGFSESQIKFLNFMRKLQELRNEQYAESGNTGEIDNILKVDRGFKETLKTGDLIEAFSAYLGNTAAIHDIELKFTDPKSGKVSLESYGDIEQKLVQYGKKGILSKLNAMRLMLKYNFKARRRSKEKFGQFSISPNGKLNNKFLKSRDKKRGYSKDFYKAALSFIDDYTHSKHLGELVPYIDAIEAINQSGYLEHAAKPQVVEYLKDWKDLHLFKNDRVGKLGPEVDAALRLLRKVTSLSVMAFNIPAAFWNTGTGIYNNIRAEGGKAQGIGLKRLLEGTNRAKFKAYNKKANDIINKYHVVSSDYDSNPKLFAGKIFDMLANGLNREAEYLIQGSMFLGQLSEADYNNLQYNDKGELEYVGNDKDAFKERVIKYKNRVSDIQGKYAEKDRRNYNLTEFGKSAAQFKNWLPDAIKERFGAQYINADNELKAGTWNSMLGEGFQDLKKQINEKGLGKAIWENKDAMANLKGALTVAVLLSLKMGDDDDKKKRGAVDNLDKALGNVLMIFDPQTLKFTVSNPVASIGTLNRFIDAFEHVIEIDNGIKFDFARAGKDIGKAIPYQKAVRQTVDLLTEE